MKGSHTMGEKSKDCLSPSFHDAVPAGLGAPAAAGPAVGERPVELLQQRATRGRGFVAAGRFEGRCEAPHHPPPSTQRGL